jgi:hypothetical protein
LSVKFTLNESIFRNVESALKDKSYCKIGVFGDTTIAGVQEYGANIGVTSAMWGYFKKRFGISLKTQDIVIPPRPFLRPVGMHEKDTFYGFLVGKSDYILWHIANGGWKSLVKMFGQTWAEYVKNAFSNNGWGQWRGLSSFTLTFGPKRPSNHPLVVTGKLKDSIKSKMVIK